jgi:hypothetical protein
MNGKPHLYKKYGYWNCNWGGFSGAGYCMKGAIESMLKHKRFWERTMNMSHET